MVLNYKVKRLITSKVEFSRGQLWSRNTSLIALCWCCGLLLRTPGGNTPAVRRSPWDRAPECSSSWSKAGDWATWAGVSSAHTRSPTGASAACTSALCSAGSPAAASWRGENLSFENHQTATAWCTRATREHVWDERRQVSLPVRSWDRGANQHVEKFLRHFGRAESGRAIDLQRQRQHPLEDGHYSAVGWKCSRRDTRGYSLKLVASTGMDTVFPDDSFSFISETLLVLEKNKMKNNEPHLFFQLSVCSWSLCWLCWLWDGSKQPLQNIPDKSTSLKQDHWSIFIILFENVKVWSELETPAAAWQTNLTWENWWLHESVSFAMECRRADADVLTRKSSSRVCATYSRNMATTEHFTFFLLSCEEQGISQPRQAKHQPVSFHFELHSQRFLRGQRRRGKQPERKR